MVWRLYKNIVVEKILRSTATFSNIFLHMLMIGMMWYEAYLNTNILLLLKLFSKTHSLFHETRNRHLTNDTNHICLGGRHTAKGRVVRSWKLCERICATLCSADSWRCLLARLPFYYASHLSQAWHVPLKRDSPRILGNPKAPGLPCSWNIVWKKPGNQFLKISEDHIILGLFLPSQNIIPNTTFLA